MSRCKPALMLLPMFLLIIYGNTFNASFHFDDYHNIVDNPRLHLTILNKDTIARTFSAGFDGGYYNSPKIYRPLTNFTFALNWLFGQDNVFGYHLVNLAIHMVASLCLYLTISALFSTPRLEKTPQANAEMIALISALFWSIHPIQTQAVTYIVQRAASMMAMFYIMGMFFYLKGRLTPKKIASIAFFAACLGAFLLALASKQNSATFPIALIFMEVIFFQDLSNPRTRKYLFIIIPLVCIIAAGVGAILFMKANITSISSGYAVRPFTMAERLLTQPRIIFFYLSLLAFPSAGRLSFIHDVPLSTSLVNPISTLPAILLILCMIGAALISIRKYPIFSFAALFFFLNHLIESTIIPLELIYEHRNYLPSMFIFIPIAFIFQKGLEAYPGKESMRYAILGGLVGVIIFTGMQTYQRNQIFQNEKVFWEDAIRKAPALARPYHNLAMYHFDRVGDIRTAFQLYNIALKLRYPERTELKATTYNNLGNIFLNQNMFEDAARMYEMALAIHPGYSQANRNLIIHHIYREKWDEALRLVDQLLSKRPRHAPYLDLKGLIFLRQNRVDEAIPFFRQALIIDPGSKKALSNLATALYLKGDAMLSDALFTRYLTRYPEDITIHLRRLENSIKAAYAKKTTLYIDSILKMFPLQEVKARIEADQTSDIVYPLNGSLLSPAIQDRAAVYF